MNTKSPPTSHRGATDVSRRLLSFLHGKTGGDSCQLNRGASGTPFLTAMTFLWPAGIVILFLIASGFLALAQAPSITPASQSAIDRNEFEKMEANAASGNAEAQDKLGVLYATGNGIDVAIHRLRKRYVEVLRELVGQTVTTPAEVNEELRYLASIIGR